MGRLSSDFPNAQAVDAALKRANKAEVDVANLTTAMAGKVDYSAYQTETQNLQGQINQIVISASAESVVAPEVAAARVGADSTSYQTLKARLDAENSKSSLIDDTILSNFDHNPATNYINYDFIKDNVYIKGQDAGQEVSFSGLYATDYIPLEEGVNYYFGNVLNGYCAFYDGNKQYISGYGNTHELTNPFTIPTGAKYGRFTLASKISATGNWIYTLNSAPAKYGMIVVSPVTNDPEVTAARNTYSTLKQRLDTERSALQTDINNTNNSVTGVRNKVNSNFIHDPSTNYIDFRELTPNAYIKGQDDGSTAYFANFYATDFIPLNEETDYYIKNILDGYCAFYDENKQYISGYGNTHELTNPFQIPEGAKYGRFTIVSLVSETQNWIFTKNSYPPKYQDMLDANITCGKIAKNTVKNANITYKSVGIDNTDFIYHDETTNYISGWKANCYIGAGGQEVTAVGLYASNPVFIEENVNYYHANLYRGYYAFYDENGNTLAWYPRDTDIPNPFTAPAGAKYARFSVTSEAQTRSAWIYPSNSEPQPFKYLLSSDIHIESENPCDYQGDDICAFTKCLCIGDSLTSGTFNHRDSGSTEYIEYDKYSYPRNLERLTNLQVSNQGVGGRTSGEWYDMKAETDLSGYDIAIIQLGVNDDIRRGQLGMTIEEWFADTTRCKFADIITKLKTENKNIKIFAANIIPARSYHSASYLAFSEYLLNWYTTTYADDPNVIPLDIMQYGHTYDLEAYNCGHLSAYGYYRLAKDYKSFISWYMAKNPHVFKEIQFIGTDYWYDDPNE